MKNILLKKYQIVLGIQFWNVMRQKGLSLHSIDRSQICMILISQRKTTFRYNNSKPLLFKKKNKLYMKNIQGKSSFNDLNRRHLQYQFFMRPIYN